MFEVFFLIAKILLYVLHSNVDHLPVKHFTRPLMIKLFWKSIS